MCENKKNITFCTCIGKESNYIFKSKPATFKVFGDTEEYNKQNYYWILVRTIRKRTDRERILIIGELVRPSKKLDKELTAEFVVGALNEKAEFDFDYLPEDGDELLVGTTYKYSQFKNYSRPMLPTLMKFVYENREWYFGYVDSFKYKQVELNRGKIMLHSNGNK